MDENDRGRIGNGADIRKHSRLRMDFAFKPVDWLSADTPKMRRRRRRRGKALNCHLDDRTVSLPFFLLPLGLSFARLIFVPCKSVFHVLLVRFDKHLSDVNCSVAAAAAAPAAADGPGQQMDSAHTGSCLHEH